MVSDDFSEPSGWRFVTSGAARAEYRTEGGRGRILHIVSAGGLAFATRELDPDTVRGASLMIRALTRVSGSCAGVAPWNRPKIQLAMVRGGVVTHVSSRFSSPSPWQEHPVMAEIPADVERVVLSLGIECAEGEISFDDVLVTDDRPETRILDLSDAVSGRLDWGSGTPAGSGPSPFPPVVSAADGTWPAVLLRGIGREDLPREIRAPIRAGALADEVVFLHATLGGEVGRETPTVIWTARFRDGQESSFSVFEGRDIGSSENRDGHSNWRIVQTGVTADGRPWALGETRWRLYSADAPLETLTVRAYSGAPAIVAAIAIRSSPVPRTVGPVADFGEEGEWEE